MSRTVLVIGGARSGKSGFAEALARRSGLSRVYVATGQAHDAEMTARITRHRADRGDGWTTVEAPLDLAAAIGRHTAADRIVLVDCLTLWLSNVMLSGDDVPSASETLIGAVGAASGPLILVSNEVGHGIVPETALGRHFRDCQGRLNQMAATVASDVFFVAAGCPTRLKPAPAAEVAW